jgi:hypothetical protein
MDPFFNAKPTPPAYDLPTTLKMLGLESRQHLRQSGLQQVLVPVELEARVTLYEAESVRVWARRLARLRLLQLMGEREPRAPLLSAPTDASRDTVCPKCGGFALFSLDRSASVCLKKHTVRR